jgi:hypothetical protein
MRENARDWRRDYVHGDTGEDLTDRRGPISRIELASIRSRSEVICTG